jgi:tetratricopeptide (TPR) repeat protein
VHDGNTNADKSESATSSDNDEEIEEIYASTTKEEVDAIIKSIHDEKAKGNEAFTAGEYAQAILFYTMALDRAAELPDAIAVNEWLTAATSSGKITQLFDRHIILSNRSACFLKLGHHDKALKDSTDAERLDPTYVKGIFRKGLALHAMGKYEEAIKSLSSAQKIEPKNAQIKQALNFAEVRMTQELRKRMQG